MADDLVQIEDGEWMRIDRRLWDALGRYKFNERELTVLKKIIRWTYGCVKETDEDKDQGRYCIIDKLEEAAAAIGLHHPALTTTLHSLCEKQVIYTLLDTKPKVIIFNKYWHSWKVPLRSKYSEEADRAMIARNLNYNTIDEAMGEETFRQMKKAYQFDKGLNDSLRKAYRIDKELNELGSKELNDSLSKKTVDINKIKPSQRLKDNIIKDNNNYDHDLSIRSDLTIIQGTILQKWGKQIINSPPQAQIITAIQECNGKDRILEAINRMPVILKDPDPMSLMAYILSVVENPTWYVQSEAKGKKPTPEQKLADAQRVYNAILNDKTANKDDLTYIEALDQAKQEVEKLKEVHNARTN